MGLFDESDSDDSEAAPAAAVTTTTTNDYVEDDDEEEDPLDAYMKSLDAAPTAPSSSSSSASKKEEGGGGRLDVDAEDEATSHWEVADNKNSSNSGAVDSRLLPKYHDDNIDDNGVAGNSSAASTREARSTMYDTFVRAGDNKHTQKQTNNNNNNEDDDDEITNLQKIRQHQKQMIHQEIDPLERVNHNKIKYEHFRRVFYTPPNTDMGRMWRKEHEVVCTPPYDPILGFGDLVDGGGDGKKGEGNAVFPEELVHAIARAGYDSPTLVQSQTLSVALSGRDALITAATGSGKTLAYIWPMIVHINDQPHITPITDGPISIILTPTRELAKQVYKHAKTFIQCIGGRAVEVAGGNRGTWELTKDLRKGCEIVVSSPGRLIDMVKKKGTNLKRVTFLVLDEADRMLDMGFEKQIGSLLEGVRPDRQTLMLSATFGKRVEKVARSWLRDPVRIAIGRTGASSEHVDSHVMVLPNRDAKIQWLMEMLPILSPLGRCLVFVATRADCDVLSQMVQNSPPFIVGGPCSTSKIVSIHGDKDQRDRNAAISQFKKNPQAILIATDVASRGLDVPDVMVVISFDAAKSMDAHVHRVGRAGRLRSNSGNEAAAAAEHQRGVAYTLLTTSNKKDANFAASLAEAFDREGREVSPELAALCHKSNRYGGGRVKHSKDGLGFEGGGAGASGGMPRTSYYGPSSNGQPEKKKSRWG